MNKQLEAYLRICNQAYVEGNPLIPDEVYDRLVENTQLENEVGSKVNEQRYTHPYQMYSLQKVFIGETKEPDWTGKQRHRLTWSS